MAFDDISDFDDFELVDKLVEEYAAKKAAEAVDITGLRDEATLVMTSQSVHVQGHAQQMSAGHAQQMGAGHAQQMGAGHAQQMGAGHAQQMGAGHAQQMGAGHAHQMGAGHAYHVNAGYAHHAGAAADPLLPQEHQQGPAPPEPYTELATESAEATEANPSSHGAAQACTPYKPQFGKRKSRLEKVVPTSTDQPDDDLMGAPPSQSKKQPAQMAVDEIDPADGVIQAEETLAADKV
ncbi:hypothetical protein CLOM_g14140 [Closterium sp. NIES-68]|nr:hypothetical protein CLOM_g14140 [Closterium sp. NIES-68]